MGEAKRRQATVGANACSGDTMVDRDKRDCRGGVVHLRIYGELLAGREPSAQDLPLF